MFCNRCLQVVCKCNPDRCTLCHNVIHEYPLWGVDFPNCGPVHGDCADYDYWLSSREDQPLQRLIQQRHIREQGWLPTPCATPIY